MKTVLYLLICLMASHMVLATTSYGQEQKAITIDLVVDHMEITAGFDGESLQIYGIKPQKGDVVLVLKGPLQNVSVRKKEQTAAGWRYSKNVIFKSVPSYYNVVSTRDLDDMLELDLRSTHEIGIDALALKGQGRVDDVSLYKKAFIRHQKGKQLYGYASSGVTEVTDRFFSTSFLLPDNVIIGDYEIEAYYINQLGQVSEKEVYPFEITHVGINSWVLENSKKHAFLYGIMCVVFALMAGWFSNRLKRIL